MKKIGSLFAAMLITLVMGFSGCNSKADTWSKDQKAKWTESCMSFMSERGVAQKDAASFCDCMLSKTSEKYTPEEAAKITPEENQDIWKQCDYQW